MPQKANKKKSDPDLDDAVRTVRTSAFKLATNSNLPFERICCGDDVRLSSTVFLKSKSCFLKTEPCFLKTESKLKTTDAIIAREQQHDNSINGDLLIKQIFESGEPD